MRASLPHTLRERRRSRADQHRRGASSAPSAPATPSCGAAPATAVVADQAAQRVREAGGPIDEAAYVCECGFMFRAAVSTTVACPHCNAPQAW